MKKVWFLFMVVLFVAGCSKTAPYEGKALHIAVIGDVPDVRETTIEFTTINFADLQQIEDYDAVFIMRDQMEEAGEKTYRQLYKKSDTPFVFINPPKGYVPPVAGVPLANYNGPDDKMYAYYYLKGNLKQYGLYNDNESKKAIQDVYTTVFEELGK